MKRSLARLGQLTTTALKKPQYDLKSLKLNPATYQESIDRRGAKLNNNTTVDAILKAYNELVDHQKSRDQLVAHRNNLQKTLQDLLKANGTDREEIKKDIAAQLQKLKIEVKRTDNDIQLLENEVFSAIETIPNRLEPDAKDEIEVIEFINEGLAPPAVSSTAAKPDSQRDHHDIGVGLGIIDFESASRVSGSSSYYLVGQGAMLEQALVSFVLAKAASKGWTLMTPPSLVRQEFTNACGFKPRDQNNEQQVYMIESDRNENNTLCLTGTAEIPLAGWAAHKTLDLGGTGILRRAGVSRSYRAEAGARGRDTRGLYRVHEFTKVELFAWTIGDIATSNRVFEEIVAFQKETISELGLYARVINIPPYDLGAPAYRKYDVECWMPGRGSWGELTSTSNCLDYQARRLHTKYHFGDPQTKPEFVHTLNGTGIAIPRTIVAILENFYDPRTQTVEIPQVLQKYMGDTHIRKNN
jgi:seryl-tRNA synthetase